MCYETGIIKEGTYIFIAILAHEMMYRKHSITVSYNDINTYLWNTHVVLNNMLNARKTAMSSEVTMSRSTEQLISAVTGRNMQF